MSEWRLEGDLLIACNCDFGCPCNFNALPSHGKCEGGWMWLIESGRIDGVDVSGLSAALFADWPAAIHQGGGRAVCYVDEKADDAQRAALTRAVRGEIGGPWGIFINTYALSGPESARFDVNLDAYDTTLRIGDDVELAFDTIKNPVTQVPVHPEMVLPEGLVTKAGKLAASKVFRFRVQDGKAYDHSGKYAAFGRFAYAS